MPNRFSRFKRNKAAVPMRLTERDREIIRQVQRHRFLRSSHIAALVGGSSQQILRRLKLLYHHGFLERPRSQLDYYHEGGTRSMVYGLGTKASSTLSANSRAKVKNYRVGRIFLNHALLVSDFMIGIELACRKHRHLRVLHNADLSLPQDVRWKVAVNGIKLTVVPDQVFALEFNGAAARDRAYFFLEADRGTMPVIRKSLKQTSFSRKLLAYEATWNQNIHRARFGFHRFRVLTVTTSAARVKSLILACSQIKSGQGLFLFADQSIPMHDILSTPWLSGRNGESTTLLS